MKVWSIGLDRNALWHRMHWSGIRTLIFTAMALFGLFAFVGSKEPLGLVVTFICGVIVVSNFALMLRSLMLWAFAHRHVLIAHRGGITIRSLWQTRTIPWHKVRRVEYVQALGGIIVFQMRGSSSAQLSRYQNILFDPYALPGSELARHLNQQRRRYTAWS